MSQKRAVVLLVHKQSCESWGSLLEILFSSKSEVGLVVESEHATPRQGPGDRRYRQFVPEKWPKYVLFQDSFANLVNFWVDKPRTLV